MKNFKAYLTESEYASENPVTGDDFEIQISVTESVETYVLEHHTGSITLAGDQDLMEILESAGLLESVTSAHAKVNGERSEDNDLEESDYEDYDDEDYEEESAPDQGFFVILDDEESTPFVGVVAKDGGKWREIGGTGGETPYNWGGTYMGYLDPEDVMTWIRRDYEKRYQVHGPFFDEHEAMRRAGLAESALSEAEYQGRKVTLNKPMRGDVKKFKVFVKDPKTGNVKKVNFGDPNMKIKKSNPARRKSFRARHRCDTARDKTTARYWSCKKW